MAHTAECAAPEESQDRDEWMTVIEMQEYMRASRNKAYDLIWSGEIDDTRTGKPCCSGSPHFAINATESGRQARRRAPLAPAHAEFLLPIACKGIFGEPGE